MYNTPIQVGLNSDWSNVVLGGNHTIVISESQNIFSCGYNLYGQIGDGTNVDKSTLTQINCLNLSNKEIELVTNNLNFYPNPAFEKINFTTEPKSVTVFDVNGRIVKNSNIFGNLLNISELNQGVYFLKIETENGIFQRKLIKK